MLTDLFEPTAPASVFEPVPVPGTDARVGPQLAASAPPDCPPQGEEEPRASYAARCLRYLLADGPLGSLTREQVEQADQAAQRQVCALPVVLSPSDQVQNQKLGQLRHRLAVELDRRRANERAFCALLASCAPDPDQDLDGPAAGQTATPVDERARTLRLLKAALIGVLEDDQHGRDSDGGQTTRLIKPSPTRPPGGSYAETPSF